MNCTDNNEMPEAFNNDNRRRKVRCCGVRTIGSLRNRRTKAPFVIHLAPMLFLCCSAGCNLISYNHPSADLQVAGLMPLEPCILIDREMYVMEWTNALCNRNNP